MERSAWQQTMTSEQIPKNYSPGMSIQNFRVVNTSNMSVSHLEILEVLETKLMWVHIVCSSMSVPNFRVVYCASKPALVVQPNVHPTDDQEVTVSIPGRSINILSWKLIMNSWNIFLRPFSPFHWFKMVSCQLVVKECACTGNRLHHQACPWKVWLGNLRLARCDLYSIDWAIKPNPTVPLTYGA